MLKSLTSAHVHPNGDSVSKMKALEMGDRNFSCQRKSLSLQKQSSKQISIAWQYLEIFKGILSTAGK